ncbi:MAG TPA: class I SAM-dependent methyltransferase [Alloacidobacterium sp.]|nr:class I SAM-dependent methyltransferase [Alloacidobacterium sp.]
MPPAPPANFDHIARPYRWLEYLSFGPMLERCRFRHISQLASSRRALVYGDGDGRFLARLLVANPHLHADVIDLSPAMLRLLESRVSAVGARNRIRIHRADALAFEPTGNYDLVVTHFFLDCFSTAEVLVLAQKIRPHIAADALWLVSEFAIPRGPAAIPAKSIVAALYSAFGLLTGLRTRTLPDHASTLTHIGFTVVHRKTFLGGLLISELWKAEST